MSVFQNVHYLSLIRLQSLAVAAHFTVEVAQLLCERHAVTGAGLVPAQLLQFTALIRCIVNKIIMQTSCTSVTVKQRTVKTHLTISKSLFHSLLVQGLLRAQQEGFLKGPSSCNEIPQRELHLCTNGTTSDWLRSIKE